MAEFNRGKFYGSQNWKKTRDAYFQSKNGLCERCLKCGVIRAGEFVHHKIHLDSQTVNDPGIALDWNNLEVLCRNCHAAEHGKRRYYVDLNGEVHVKGDPPITESVTRGR